LAAAALLSPVFGDSTLRNFGQQNKEHYRRAQTSYGIVGNEGMVDAAAGLDFGLCFLRSNISAALMHPVSCDRVVLAMR
jgi:hypothetical protein